MTGFHWLTSALRSISFDMVEVSEEQARHLFYERVLETNAYDCPHCPRLFTVTRVGVYAGYDDEPVYEYRKCKRCGCYVYRSGNTWEGK
jgi:hypothetical protein